MLVGSLVLEAVCETMATSILCAMLCIVGLFVQTNARQLVR